jgi:YVTN family beta-propeller protein
MLNRCSSALVPVRHPATRARGRRPAARAAATAITAAAALTLGGTAWAAPLAKHVPNTVIATISDGIATPEFTSVDPARGVVWVAGPYQAAEIKESTRAIIRTVSLDSYPDTMTIDPLTGNLILGNTDGTVTLLKEATGAQTEIPVANPVNSFAEGIGVDIDTGNIYVTDEGAPDHGTTISVISQQTDSVTDAINDPREAEAVAVNPGTGTVYVSNLWTGDIIEGSVWVIREKTNKVIATIPSVGDAPFTMTVDPVSGKLFAANYFQHSVAVINTRSDTVTGQINTGSGNPDYLAADPVNGMVYVNDFDSGNVWVISEKTSSVVATIPVPDAAGGIDVDPGRALVYASSDVGSTAVIQAAPPSLDLRVH